MQTTPGLTRETTDEQKKEKKKKTVGQEILSWVFNLALALAIAMLIRTFLFTLITVSGSSMMDTLLNGDKLYVSVLSAKLEGYDHGDIVICHYPGRTDYIVKRVIGLPGDEVIFSDNRLTVNGRAVSEPYVSSPTEDYAVLLGEDEFLVLGDNREVSYDSRMEDMGPIGAEDFLGQAFWIIWPPSRIGRID